MRRPIQTPFFPPPAAVGEGLASAPYERPRFATHPRSQAGAHGAHGEVRAAVNDAYRKHHGLVYRLALRYGRGRVAFAEDVVQEVFLQLWRHAAVVRDLDAVEGWLYRATTRRCFNKLRNERLVGLLTFRWLRPDAEPSVDAHALHGAREELRRAFDALSTLPAKERVAFSMFHLDGKSQDEIGAVLGHSKGYVCKLIQRASEKLKKLGWEVAP